MLVLEGLNEKLIVQKYESHTLRGYPTGDVCKYFLSKPLTSG